MKHRSLAGIQGSVDQFLDVSCHVVCRLCVFLLSASLYSLVFGINPSQDKMGAKVGVKGSADYQTLSLMCSATVIPVVPHKAVVEVSKIGSL